MELVRFFQSLPSAPQVYALIPPPGFDAQEGGLLPEDFNAL